MEGRRISTFKSVENEELCDFVAASSSRPRAPRRPRWLEVATTAAQLIEHITEIIAVAAVIIDCENANT